MKGAILNVALHGQKLQNNLAKAISLIILFSFSAFCAFKYGVPELPDAVNQGAFDSARHSDQTHKYKKFSKKAGVFTNLVRQPIAARFQSESIAGLREIYGAP